MEIFFKVIKPKSIQKSGSLHQDHQWNQTLTVLEVRTKGMGSKLDVHGLLRATK
jgi:hypothetical protein